MPTYQNRTGVITNIGEYQFAPFETRQLKKNIYWTPPVFIIDTAPEYNPYIIQMKNGNLNERSIPFLHTHSFIIRVDDQFPQDFYEAQPPVKINPDGSTLDLGVFASVGDYHVDSAFQLMRVVNYKKYDQWWYATTPGSDHIPQMLIDMEYEVVYFRILKFNSTVSNPSVDISIKPF